MTDAHEQVMQTQERVWLGEGRTGQVSGGHGVVFGHGGLGERLRLLSQTQVGFNDTGGQEFTGGQHPFLEFKPPFGQRCSIQKSPLIQGHRAGQIARLERLEQRDGITTQVG